MEHAPTLSSSIVFTLGFAFVYFQELGGASYAFVHTFSNSYEKWDIYNLLDGSHLCVLAILDI